MCQKVGAEGGAHVKILENRHKEGGHMSKEGGHISKSEEEKILSRTF